MKIKLIRHATCIIDIGGVRVLLDPILYKKGVLSPANGGVSKNNPTVDLKKDVSIHNDNIDAILLTHPHRDHIDKTVMEVLGGDIAIICPEYYVEDVKELGFKNIIPIAETGDYKGIKIKLTVGHHGMGEIEKVMNKSFGYVLSSDNKKLYITGDTVWCDEVKAVLENEKPNYILAFTGNAVLNGNKITMGVEDIQEVLNHTALDTIILPIHLEAWNHCILKRADLAGLDQRLSVIADNETIQLN